jgi:hypothetical protein
MTDLQPMVYTPVSAVANLRRSVIISAFLAAVAIVVCSVAGHPLMGVFVGFGLALGALNNLALQRSVVAHATQGVSKGRVQAGVALRLGSITLLSIALALLIRPDGIGTFAGLAVFQILMLVGAAVPVFRSMRPTA